MSEEPSAQAGHSGSLAEAAAAATVPEVPEVEAAEAEQASVLGSKQGSDEVAEEEDLGPSAAAGAQGQLSGSGAEQWAAAQGPTKAPLAHAHTEDKDEGEEDMARAVSLRVGACGLRVCVCENEAQV